LRRWIFVSLGASDIQYKSDRGKPPEERRLKNYAQECESLYQYLKDTCDVEDLDVPLIRAIVDHLLERKLPPDVLVAFYTHQNPNEAGSAPGRSKDTYWAFRIIQYLAQETDYFGVRFRVEGIHVRGNPADYEQMVYLYKDIMTVDQLKRLGVQHEDELYASFTAGAPAMCTYLLMGYSGLHFPRKRECFSVHMVDDGSVIRQLPAYELLRHDDIFRLLKKLLESRQFNEAILLMSSASFSFLHDCRQEAGDWIRLLQERYLFCFDRALRILRKCHSAFAGEPFHDRMKRELETLGRGMAKYQRIDSDALSAPELKALMGEYLHKVLFFWDSGQWNEFAYVASSFYEWIIQVAFFDAVGYSLARQNGERKRWGHFLKRVSADLPDWLKLVVDTHDDKESDRYFCTRVLRQSGKWAAFANSEWFRRMNVFYIEVRNTRVHQLRGTERDDVLSLLGEDWPKKTKSILSDHFGIDAGISNFNRAVEDYIDYLNKKFAQKYSVTASWNGDVL
jgi:hypothetical protein